MRSLEFEVKIGLFVFVGLILLTVITFSIGDFFFKTGYNLNVVMAFANGVEKAAPVRLAGVEVGEVKSATVFKNKEGMTKVKLVLWLTNDAKVEEDSRACINTLGLIGEKYVEIIPGTPGSPILKNNGMLSAYDSVSVEQMTKKGYEIALKLEQVVDSMDSILAQVKSGQGTIGKLVYDDGLYNDLEAMVKDLKAHPWKLMNRPRGSTVRTEDKSTEGNRGKF
ncbi:MAG: MCE family protein [Candidatus Omnitrophica bacterium]|nr:MCE family protein [Candidatus Omnitrophota bacterium]